MKVLEVLLEDAKTIYAVGDSLAVGVVGAGAKNGGTQNGIGPQAVLDNIKQLVKNPDINGAVVVVGSGAPNNKSQINLVNDQLKVLKQAGATPFLLGAGPGGDVTQAGGGVKKVDLTGVSEQLESIASANGVAFSGHLRDLGAGMLAGDGIHLTPAGYKALYNKASSTPVKAPVQDKKQDAQQGAEQNPQGQVSKDLIIKAQQELDNAGYDLGPTGVDGVLGKWTMAALRAVAAGKGPSAKGTLDIGELSQDSVTQGKVGALLNFIAKPESGGSYDVMNGGRHFPEILKMSLNDLLKFQASYIQRGGSESSAAGRYQYMPGTIKDIGRKMGVDFNTQVFDPAFQDRLAIYHMRIQCGLDNWLQGKLDNETFLNSIAQIWAGIPKTSGQSAYAGVGSNRAGLSAKVALNSLQQIQTA